MNRALLTDVVTLCLHACVRARVVSWIFPVLSVSGCSKPSTFSCHLLVRRFIIIVAAMNALDGDGPSRGSGKRDIVQFVP